MSDVDGLRAQIAEALKSQLRGSPTFGGVTIREMLDNLLPVVTAWAEQQARQRAAEELRAAAAHVRMPGNGRNILLRRAAALADDGQP